MPEPKDQPSGAGSDRTGTEVDLFTSAVPDDFVDRVQRMCRELRDEELAEPGPDPMVGRRLGAFRIDAPIGRGGMGCVYRATTVDDGAQVAIKVLAPERSPLPRAVERFRREVDAVVRLEHPGIVRVLDYGREENVDFLVMELIEGADLRTWIGELHKRRITHPDRELELLHEGVEIVAEVATALHHAHERGIIHRDVKPQNVLVDREGHARVVDFGLAKDVEEVSLSREGELSGTYHYLSPEQALAKRAGVDQRTDVFSLGVILYQLLTGNRPFEGESQRDIIYKISFEDPRALRQANPNIPRELELICSRAMEKRPHHRYPTAAAFADDLRSYLRGQSPDALRYAARTSLRRFVRRHRVALRVVGVVAGLLAVVGLGMGVQSAFAASARLGTVAFLVEPGARVEVAARRLEGRTKRLGSAEALGSFAGDRDARVEHGFWRFVVTDTSGRRGEFARRVTEGSQLVIDARRLPALEVAGDMVRFDGGTFPFDASASWRDLESQQVEIAPFAIDRREVSVRDYLAFVDWWNQRNPDDLRDVPGMLSNERAEVPDEWLDKPIVGVTWAEARDYAEWAGKRLPTVFEWQFAALADPRETEDVRAAVVGREGPPADVDDLQAWAFDQLELAGEAGDRTVHGVRHLLGNAAEWCETPAARSTTADGLATWSFFTAGDHWGYPVEERPTVRRFRSVRAETVRLENGFRCARSL